jgi:endonuclease/exonuclease/phosphatase family metal-dependent hydrolase
LSILRKIILVINVLFALCLIIGGWSIYIDPNSLWEISFFGLLFPAWIVINLFFVFFWMIARIRYTTISIVAILLTIPALKNYLAFHPHSSDPSSSAVKLMSYNVRNFDLYNWKNGAATMKKIMELIKKERPDIICLQEFFNADTGRFQTIKQLMEQSGFSHYQFEKTVAREHYGAWGVATFSRFPIVNSGSLRFANSKLNSSLFTDIKIDTTTVRIFNVHLQSVYLSEGDYEYIEQVTENQNVQVKPTKQIISKLKHAFEARAVQSVQLKKEISDSPFAVLVCGDFNDTPSSFCYHTISSNLNDAFLCAGNGIGPTYSGIPSPFRIDYILGDKKFSLSNYKTICENLSDHYAVTCRIEIRK